MRPRWIGAGHRVRLGLGRRADGVVTETTRRVIGPDGVDEVQVDLREELPVGVRYPIDGLVGQINGRPVFADEFLVPLEDRISDRRRTEPEARFEIRRLVTGVSGVRRLELIIAEASSLTPEMQQGVFAWLQNLQEETITNRGGTRETAASSIEDEFGLSIEEFMAQRRSLALAGDLRRSGFAREPSSPGGTWNRPTARTRPSSTHPPDRDRPDPTPPGPQGRGVRERRRPRS